MDAKEAMLYIEKSIKVKMMVEGEDYKLYWKKNHMTDTGFDIMSNETVIIPAHGRAVIKTGVSLGIPEGYWIKIDSRSGLSAKHGIQAGAGVIDEDYTGEVRVVLFNHSNKPFKVERYDRIAQAILTKRYDWMPEIVKTLDDTTRGDKGFGSSGVK